MNKTLLPCPFCGGEVKLMAIAGEPYPPTYEVDIANITVESDDICYVHCPTCGANWHIELRIDAFPLKTIAAWNRRTGKGINVTTNADRIRGMSVEEMAEFITLSPEMEFDVCLCCKNGNPYPDDRGICLTKHGHCEAEARCEALKDWLKQPVKEE